MARDRPFLLSFTVSAVARRDQPDAFARLIERQKATLAKQETATGPRGGLYRFITPPDGWQESQDYGYDFIRGVVRIATRRIGCYQRPRSA